MTELNSQPYITKVSQTNGVREVHLSTAREADTWTFVIGGQINSITEKTKQRKSKKNRFLNRKEEKARAISQTHTQRVYSERQF